MKKVKIAIGTLFVLFTLSMTTNTQSFPELKREKPAATAENADDGNAVVQLALLLDTSGSMSGLIEQTKSQLWKITNELSSLKKNGETPRLQIALYEYGTSSRAELGENSIRKISNFTTDMDKVSEELFALTTSGSAEYCGLVIQKSLNELEWSNNTGNLHVIYIAGNESFAQGPVGYQSAAQLAESKDVIVNTIFCGPQEKGIELQWKNGALLAGGDYASIDHNQKTVYVETPFDKQITALNAKLNTTYISYGKEGKRYLDNQVTQDNNAAQYSVSNMAERATFKTSKNYSNEQWDLVDAYAKDKKVIKKAKDLPAELKDKTEAEVEAIIQQKGKERAAIKQEIQSLNQQRKKYLTQQATKNSETSSLENSILESVKKQARQKGFTVEGDVPTTGSSNIDYPGFMDLSNEAYTYREQRIISMEEFSRFAKEPGTIILDTRSASAYKGKHLKGAVHLNFSDFTARKLAKVIPSKDTKILIYCNNNFLNDPASFAMKSKSLALNIPTFINLYGYGYKNIYEMGSLLPVTHPSLEFEGTLVEK